MGIVQQQISDDSYVIFIHPTNKFPASLQPEFSLP
jgi:hypothetical protein